jgi:hypothetical protein
MGLFSAFTLSMRVGEGGECLGHVTDHSHPVMRLRMHGVIPPFPHIPSWCAQEKLHFYLHTPRW